MAFDTDVVCTITLTSGSKDFTVAGANLTTEIVQPGEQILLPAKALTLTIGEVLTATTGRLTDNCPAAAAGAAQPARIHYQADLSRALAEMVNLRKLLGAGNVDALAGLTLAAGKGIRATGLNTLATYDFSTFMVGLAASANGPAVYSTLGQIPNAQIRNDLTPDKAFRHGNILGTVAQSGGVPTGAIMERGLNASGYYERYASGLLINYLTGTFDCTNAATQNYTLASSGLGTPFAVGAVWPLVNNGADHAAFRSAAPVMTAGGTTVAGLRGTGVGSVTNLAVSLWTFSRWY